MTDLGTVFAELGISQYLEEFLSNGFDTWETILDITESDFDVLGVKLGHRRKLQRKIANARGLSSDRALGSPPRTLPPEEAEGQKSTAKDGGSGTQLKRKYRRHPKQDINAPERPPSAYVIFSNKMRDDIKGRNLSFTEIAKLVGENWHNLRPHEKELYEQQANKRKERYVALMMEYKKTPLYREYDAYLKEFKAKQSNQPHVPDMDAKRPKIEARDSHNSGTTSSGTSQHGGDTPSSRVPLDSPTGLGSWADSQTTAGTTRSQSSPSIAAGTLPGYRDMILAPNKHTLTYRDAQREESVSSQQQQPPSFPRADQRPYSTRRGAASPGIPVNQFTHRLGNTGHQQSTPPLLSSESTNDSTSTSSSAYYSQPRTPMDAHVAPPLPYFTQKSSGSYQNQLPPLHTPSLSPQTTSMGSIQSPIGAHLQGFQPPSLPPVRDLYTTTDFDSRSRDDYASKHPATELDLLVKAAELADR